VTNTRPPAVAGAFYPGNPEILAATVDQFLSDATATPATQAKALVVPHAGYVYSGATAGRAYALLAPWRTQIRRVILLGPTHRVAVDGIAVPQTAAFATPLGPIPLDTAAIASLADLPQILASDRAHAQEHSLEVHLPFLQRLLGHFTLVPLAVGHAAPREVAEVLDRLWGGPETLIVVSSDMSHFLPYAAANQIDRDTCAHILQLDTHIRPEQACGAYPINGLLLTARQRRLTPRLIDHCNSGDTAGDKKRVVGYAAFSFTEADNA